MRRREERKDKGKSKGMTIRNPQEVVTRLKKLNQKAKGAAEEGEVNSKKWGEDYTKGCEKRY